MENEELLQEAARVGCRQIYYGVESADTTTLRAINKEVSIEQIRQAIKMVKKIRHKNNGFFYGRQSRRNRGKDIE
jgi:radical SAM superfamily enzyme YgiQ (UPF0313 family)